jgi:RimJ/RimL family protein N-acetyltransferase
MSAPPKTRLEVSRREAEQIRELVRRADPKTLSETSAVASSAALDGLYALLSDPLVSGPIYDLPRPLTRASVANWLADAEAARDRGEGLLLVTLDAHNAVAGYSRFTVWPELAAGELAGARRRDLQGAGTAVEGAARAFDWMFEALGLRLICLTAAFDNERSKRIIAAAGFRAMGERISVRPDGARRRSLYWELTRDEWNVRRLE